MPQVVNLKEEKYVDEFRSYAYNCHKENKFTNVKIICDSQVYYAHAFIIAIQSDFFHKLLYNHHLQNEEIVIYLPEWESDVIEIGLEYIYSGNVKNNDILKKAKELFQLNNSIVIIPSLKNVKKEEPEDEDHKNTIIIDVNTYEDSDHLDNDGSNSVRINSKLMKHKSNTSSPFKSKIKKISKEKLLRSFQSPLKVKPLNAYELIKLHNPKNAETYDLQSQMNYTKMYDNDDESMESNTSDDEESKDYSKSIICQIDINNSNDVDEYDNHTSNDQDSEKVTIKKERAHRYAKSRPLSAYEFVKEINPTSAEKYRDMIQSQVNLNIDPEVSNQDDVNEFEEADSSESSSYKKPKLCPLPQKSRKNVSSREEDPHICTDCDIVFDSATDVKHHRLGGECKNSREAQGKNPLTCKFCDRTLGNLLAVIKHEQKVHVDRKEGKMCEICGEVQFGVKIFTHKLTHRDYSFTCQYCNQQFIDLRGLNKHISHFGPNHNLDKGHYECEDCDQIFNSLQERRAHRRDNHRENDLRCDKCPKTFKIVTLLRKHILKEHPDKDIDYSCKVCNAKIGSKDSLRLHSRLFHDEGNYKCPNPDCTETFNLRHKLRSHVFTYHREKRHKCTQCSYSCKESNGLAKHIMNSHMEDSQKTFQCAQCGKGFAERFKLMRHMKSHNKGISLN